MKKTVVAFIALLCIAVTGHAQQIDRHIAGGEFGAAIQAANQLGGGGRDPLLAQIASAQSSAGENVAAAGTVAGIGSPDARNQAIEGARGGGAFADFQSLIDLIQTTVVPDTWEVLGGPSTMAPYPAGVYVDAQGTLQECDALIESDAVAELKALLQPKAQTTEFVDQWRQPAKLRFVSLKRLLAEVTHHRISGRPLPESLNHMAGLSRVQYLFVEEDDIVIAGPVGGIENQQGWYRDRTSGLNAMRLDFFLTSLQSSLANQPFGCTIDPTTRGLQQAATVAAAVQADKIPIGKAADEMSNALGMQRVEVFGTAGDTTIGYLMVEADRHMKELALGIHDMPEGVQNYLDIVDANIARGVPSDLLLRLWFTAKPRAVRTDDEGTTFEIGGSPIQLSGQNERAVASGQRGHVTNDFRTQAFVEQFNRHFGAIRTKYPVYASLESIYRSASVAELMRRHAQSDQHRQLLEQLASDATTFPQRLVAPKQVQSIATLHTVVHGRKRHHVVLASGGVAVNSRQTLVSRFENYPSLQSLSGQPQRSQPKPIQRWWWDASRQVSRTR